MHGSFFVEGGGVVRDTVAPGPTPFVVLATRAGRTRMRWGAWRGAGVRTAAAQVPGTNHSSSLGLGFLFC